MILLDEMIGPVVASALGRTGLDATAVAARADLRAMPDDELLAYADSLGLILVTRNIGEFARLHARWLAAGRLHAGLIMLPETSFPQNRRLVDAVVEALTSAWTRGELPDRGEVFYLPAPGTADK